MTVNWTIAYLSVSLFLFAAGTAGFFLRRNILAMLMSIELMLNGANVALVTFSKVRGGLDGRVIAALIIIVAASEAAIGLALLVAVHRKRGTTNVGALVRLGEPKGPRNEAAFVADPSKNG